MTGKKEKPRGFLRGEPNACGADEDDELQSYRIRGRLGAQTVTLYSALMSVRI